MADMSKPAVLRHDIRSGMPRILEILLLDRTASVPDSPANIRWANAQYIQYGSTEYAAKAPIRPELITGEHGAAIVPRAMKAKDLQKERTRAKAEVFTPLRVVKLQNDAADGGYETDDLQTYIRRAALPLAPLVSLSDSVFASSPTGRA